MDEDQVQPSPARERTVDLESLKALAHPLRVKIFDVLSTYGAFTASGLAERLGESSGATSYHLRQLGKHGFVREVEGKGSGRERWWERVPGGITLASDEAYETSSGREATKLIMHEWTTARERTLGEFVERGIDELPKKWTEASTVSLTNITVTAEQLNEFTERYLEMAAEFSRKHRGQMVAGSRPVQLQFNAFPVIDGDEIPEHPENLSKKEAPKS